MSQHEKPLGPGARAGLVVNAGLTIFLFYLIAVLFMVGLSAIALLLLIVAVGAARFGLASAVTRVLQIPLRLMGILARRLWLATTPTYQLALTPNDAPGLFEMSRALSRRAALAAPESIAIEMHVNAWVLLRGYRRGRGRTRLGIGFDLLAGLTVSEVEAVLAHELTHARLVQRGFSRWLKKGLARLSQVTTELSACANAYRRANARSDLADTTFQAFDGLTRRAARLVATYARQDEFAADRGAVDLCGAAAVRSALSRLEALDDVVSALPWSERLARLQPGEAFTAWLVSELAGERPGERNPAGVYEQVVLAAGPAAIDRAGTRFGAPFFACRWLESATARDQSISPAACSSASSSSCSRSHTPACCQSRNRRQAVIPQPKPSSCGRCSQPIPVCSTNKIPCNTKRSSSGLRPG